jgi:hypothetical protein
MKIDLTTGAWQHDIGCPISITLLSTSDGVLSLCLEQQIKEEKKHQQKYIVALDGCRRIKIIQQPTKSTPARQRR